MSVLSTGYNRTIDVGLLILRLGMGVLLASAGYNKLVNWNDMKANMMNFLGLGQTASLGLLIFAEFFCSILVVFGLFTRFAAIPPVIAMLVAVFMAHKGLIFGEGQHAFLFAIGFLTLVFTGGGRLSADSMLRRK